MTKPSAIEPQRVYTPLAVLAPATAVLLAWTMLEAASLQVRATVIVMLLGALALLAVRLPHRQVWVSYGAASVAVMLPLLVAASADLPREILVLQWIGIFGVAAVVVYFVRAVREHHERMGRLEELKRNFVALAHHELRTPVAVLHGTIDTLVDDLRDVMTPQQESFLLAARSNSGALAYLIETMTQFHELENAPPGERAPAAPFGSLVHAKAFDLRQLYDQHGVELEIRLAPEAALSAVPRPYASIVLEQLLHNAAKFNHPGGHAAVEAHVDGKQLIVTVSDDGQGIPADHHDCIFDSFYQDGEILARSAGGLGLGLALVRAAVDKMHGTIELASGPGEGSVFTVRLPRRPAAPEVL